MSDEKFIGRIYNYNPKDNTLLIKIDFTDIEQQSILEQMYSNQDMFTFWFKKPFRESKKYHQLKYYFSMLKKILVKLDISPESKNIRCLDEDIKKTCLKCDFIEIEDRKIPLIPSKAELSFEDMENLNKLVENRYQKFLDNVCVGE